MDEYDLEEMLGEAFEDDDLLGRRRRGGRARRGGMLRRGAAGRFQAGRGRSFVRPGYGPGIPSYSPLMPVLPGAPGISGLQVPLGFGSHIFLNAAATTVTLTARPQRPVRPIKLVIIVDRSANATAEVVTVTNLQVGQVSQFAGSAALPAQAFTAANTMPLAGTSAQPGIDVTITIAVSAAPAANESIGVTPMLVCDAVG